jgi:hypothetical protein
MYLLTIKSGKAITRIQIGCMNDMALDMLCYADACGTFYSFTKVDADRLPVRDEDELFRVESFIKLTREFAARVLS